MRVTIICLLLSATIVCSAFAQVVASSPACAPSSNEAPAATQFSKVAKAVQSWTLPDDGPDAVFGVRSLDFAVDGRALIADSRNGRVLLFDAGFRTAQIIGRVGQGPGEYQKPRYAVFSADNSISILDYTLARAVLFDPTGKFVRIIRMPTSDSRLIFPLSDGGYAVAGNTMAGGEAHLLTRIDGEGRDSWRSVPTDPILRAINLIVDDVWMARAGVDEVVIGLSVAPTISRVRLSDGAVTCQSMIPAALWRQLTPADRPKQETLPNLRAWIERANLVSSAVQMQDGHLVLTTVRGGAEDEVREWLVFDAALTLVARVTGVPGRAVASHANNIFLFSGNEDGKSVISRVTVKLPGR